MPIRMSGLVSGMDTESIIKEFKILEPFGKGNPKPVFADKNIRKRKRYNIHYLLSGNQQLYGKRGDTVCSLRLLLKTGGFYGTEKF